ncbi:MAG TPA: ATP-binding protein [Planctomycetaceae bacterium]|jgi:serine/threonine-protein kinase RsbW
MSTIEEVMREFEEIIPSNTAAGQSVQERIIQLLEELRFEDRDVFGIRLALEEALVNAIKHGNQMDPSKTVRIMCRAGFQKVRIEIEDQGEGFHPADVPDPTADENLERPCGRGIMLMRAFMTSITFNPSGNCVILEKVRSEPEAESETAQSA